MKKQNIKKIASLLAVAMTMTTVMAGCGNSSSNNAATTTAPAATTTAASGTNNATEETTTVAEKTGSIKVMTYDRANMPASEGDLNNNRWTTWIRENAPVAEIEFHAIPKAEAPETMQMLFAAGEAPDVLPNYEAFLPFVQNGMALELTDEVMAKLPNFQMVLDKYPMARKTGTFDGKLMAFTKFSNIGGNHTMVYRKDWLDNLGLEVPTTPDELFDVIYAFTYNDPDGNGQNDTWGINLTTDAQRVLAHMYGFPNPQKYAMVDGELVYAWDRIEAWVTFCKKVVDAGCVNPDFLTMKGDDDQADFINEKIGIYCSGRFTSSSKENLFRNFWENIPDAVLDTMPLPVTEFGQYTGYANGGSSITGFINSETENLDAALAYVNWMYDPEVSRALKYGPEDGVYFTADEYGTYVAVDTEKNATEFDWAGDYHIITNELFTGAADANTSSPWANAIFNQYLTTDDPMYQFFGDLTYKFAVIANDKDTIDPRKWLNDGLPVLPSDLALIQSTADSQVNNILKAALADKAKTAQDAVAEAKAAWYDAGGQQVDDYYANYYREAGDSALLSSDFTGCKSEPEMTPAAKANSKLFN